MTQAYQKRAVAIALVAIVVVLTFLRLRSKEGESNPQAAEPQEPGSSATLAPGTTAPPNKEKTTNSFTPELAQLEMLEFEKEENIIQRSILYASLVRRLCEAGYYEEAWEIAESQPAGANRSNSLNTFFDSAGELDPGLVVQKIAFLQTEGLPEEAMVVVGSYLTSVELNQIDRIVDHPKFKELIESLKSESAVKLQRSVFSTFAKFVPIHGQIPPFNTDFDPGEVIKTSREFLSQGLLGEEQVTRLIQSMGVLDPFQKWQALSDTISEPENPGDFHRAELIRLMVIENPGETLTQIVAFEGDHTQSDFRTALRNWSRLDSEAAGNWMNEHTSSLPPLKKEAAATEFSEIALKVREYETARQWARKIEDPAKRDALLAKIPGSQ